MDLFALVSLTILGLVYLASCAFWFYHYNKLLNKFMSRNYAEYAQAERLIKSNPIERVKEEVQDLDGYDLQRAKEINSLFNMGG